TVVKIMHTNVTVVGCRDSPVAIRSHGHVSNYTFFVPRKARKHTARTLIFHACNESHSTHDDSDILFACASHVGETRTVRRVEPLRSCTRHVVGEKAITIYG